MLAFRFGFNMAISTEDRQVILSALENGETLRKSCVGICSASSVLRLCNEDAEFSEQYARARETGYRLLADQIIEISDDGSGDVIDTEHGPKANPEFAARSRLRVDSRKWMLSKMLPKIYGEKTEVDIKARVTITATPLDEQL